MTDPKEDSTESESASEPGVSDDKLPEDLQPSEDNPLAEPLDPDAEQTKSEEELGMQDTHEDTSGTYASSGPTPSSADEGDSPDHE